MDHADQHTPSIPEFGLVVGPSNYRHFHLATNISFNQGERKAGSIISEQGQEAKHLIWIDQTMTSDFLKVYVCLYVWIVSMHKGADARKGVELSFPVREDPHLDLLSLYIPADNKSTQGAEQFGYSTEKNIGKIKCLLACKRMEAPSSLR